VPGFVPSDFVGAYRVLRAVAEADAAPGVRLCEWGSGFGVNASLAAILDFEAWGVEIEAELVEAARQLAEDYELPAEFVHGSFIPPGGGDCIDEDAGYSWLTPREAESLEELELDPADFDVILAYPWPDEEGLVEALFERHATPGTLLVTYHSGDDWHVRRKRNEPQSHPGHRGRNTKKNKRER
jgi:SAM-dependent methyltransferase